jgi:hypothetical protein
MAATKNSFDLSMIVGYFSILVIVVCLAFIGLKITGHATDTATVNVTITETAAINFTTDFVNFTDGSVTEGAVGATLDTEGTVTDGTWGATNTGLVLENIGNMNVTLSLKSDKNATQYLGTGSSFKIKVTDKEAGACVGNAASDYTEITTQDLTVCTPLQSKDTADEIDVDIELYIPSASLTGSRTATITATGN